jgi:CBS domain-containing protein
MNVLAPVSSIMTTELIVVTPDDSLSVVKEIFEKNNIHHLPVARHQVLLGIISKSDFVGYCKGLSSQLEDKFLDHSLLDDHTALDIMVTKVAKLEPNDRINVAIEIFLAKRFHSLPIIDDGRLVGIVTVYDLLKSLSKEKILDSDY